MENGFSNRATSITIVFFAFVMLFLSLFIGLVMLQGPFFKTVSENVVYLAELKVSPNDIDLKQLIDEVSKEDGVFDVQYIAKEIGLQKMKSEMSFLEHQDSLNNPFQDYLSFHIKSNKSSTEIKSITEKLSSLGMIHNVYYQELLMTNLKKLVMISSIITFVLTIFLISISYILIFYFIKILVLINHKEINTMKMVGANNQFIKKPYIDGIRRLTYKSILIYMSIYITIVLVLFFKIPLLAVNVSIFHFIFTFIAVVVLILMLNKFTINIILNTILNKKID